MLWLIIVYLFKALLKCLCCCIVNSLNYATCDCSTFLLTPHFLKEQTLLNYARAVKLRVYRDSYSQRKALLEAMLRLSWSFFIATMWFVLGILVASSQGSVPMLCLGRRGGEGKLGWSLKLWRREDRNLNFLSIFIPSLPSKRSIRMIDWRG